jgi:hypothetical protein
VWEYEKVLEVDGGEGSINVPNGIKHCKMTKTVIFIFGDIGV